jgi:hypothetical protein
VADILNIAVPPFLYSNVFSAVNMLERKDGRTRCGETILGYPAGVKEIFFSPFNLKPRAAWTLHSLFGFLFDDDNELQELEKESFVWLLQT